MTKKTWATAATRSVATIIKQTPIRRDQEGRYCLNDLHKAAGGEDKHSPRFWLRSTQTQELAEAIVKCADSHINPIDLSRGRYGGTYVHEDLAIDYAAWVSPVFKLEVYRAFKETRQSHETDIGDSIVPAGTPLVSLLEQALESEKRRLVLEAELEKAKPRIAFSQAVEADETTRTIRETAKQFGMSDQRLTAFLIQNKVLFRVPHPKDGQSQVLPYQKFIDDGAFVIRTHAVAANHIRSRTHVTGKGLIRIHRLLTKRLNS